MLWAGLVVAGFILQWWSDGREAPELYKWNRLRQENTLLEEQLSALQERQALFGKVAGRLQGFRAVAAEALFEDLSPRRRSALLGVGAEDGVAVHQGVVSEAGVVGIITEVGPHHSRLRLADDAEFRILFTVKERALTGIAAGGPRAGELHPFLLKDSSGFRVGDLLVTAGGDGVFPRGFVIGEVVFAEVPARRTRIATSQDLSQTRRVLVLVLPELEPSQSQKKDGKP